VLDPLEVVVVDDQRRHSEPPARAILDHAAAPALGQLVLGDPEQPGARRRLAHPVPRTRVQRGGEHLGGQVGSDFGIGGAPDEERQHRALVALVEGRERDRIPWRRRQHALVALGLPATHRKS
jgi:hypothetical protein